MTDFSAATVNAEVRQHVLEVIKDAQGASVKERIRSAARALRLPFSRVRKYRYGEVARIEAHEAQQIRYYAIQAKRRHLDNMAREFNAERASLMVEAALANDEALVRLLPPEIPIVEEQP